MAGTVVMLWCSAVCEVAAVICLAILTVVICIDSSCEAAVVSLPLLML